MHVYSERPPGAGFHHRQFAVFQKQHLARVIADPEHEFVEGQLLPRRRLELLLRVRPGVGVMQVEEEGVAGGLQRLAHEVEQVREMLVALAGKTHDERRAQHGARQARAQLIDADPVGVAAIDVVAHLAQIRSAEQLQGEPFWRQCEQFLMLLRHFRCRQRRLGCGHSGHRLLRRSGRFARLGRLLDWRRFGFFNRLGRLNWRWNHLRLGQWSGYRRRYHGRLFAGNWR